MNAKRLIELVQSAIEQEMDYYKLAAFVAEEQKEEDASTAESMGATSVAAVIRGNAS